MTSLEHPAKYTNVIVEAISATVNRHLGWGHIRVLDPFAGVGGIHALAFGNDEIGITTVGVELEPEWAAADPRTIVGDATALPFADSSFDCVATSPCYGNRVADHHDAKDACKNCNGSGMAQIGGPGSGIRGVETCKMCKGRKLSKRNTYRHTLGRKLTDGSAGAMQWGKEYRRLHEKAWDEVARVLKPNGLFLLNVSNHIRKGEEVRVAEWHLGAVLERPFALLDVQRIGTPRQRLGQNRELRVDGELLIALRRMP